MIKLLLVVLAVAGLLGYLYFRTRRPKPPASLPAPSEAPAQDGDDFEDLNEKFFRVAHGRPALQVIKVYDPFDKDQLRALLDSEGIVTYTEFENINSLMPGFGITGYSEVFVSVLEEDVTAARPIVLDYIEFRREALKKQPPGEPHVGKTVTKAFLDIDGFRGNLPEWLGPNPE